MEYFRSINISSLLYFAQVGYMVRSERVTSEEMVLRYTRDWDRSSTDVKDVSRLFASWDTAD
ncbi:MAG: hypothetical protein HFG85_07905 [Dorea sp.]|nr:hypothetical protein [Dorea sp.]